MSFELLQRFLIQTPLGLAAATLALIMLCVVCWLSWVSARAVLIGIYHRVVRSIDGDFNDIYAQTVADNENLRAKNEVLLFEKAELVAREARLIRSGVMLKQQLVALMATIEGDAAPSVIKREHWPSASDLGGVSKEEMELIDNSDSAKVHRNFMRMVKNSDPETMESGTFGAVFPLSGQNVCGPKIKEGDVLVSPESLSGMRFVKPEFNAKVNINLDQIGNFKLEDSKAVDIAKSAGLSYEGGGFNDVDGGQLAKFFHLAALEIAYRQPVKPIVGTF